MAEQINSMDTPARRGRNTARPLAIPTRAKVRPKVVKAQGFSLVELMVVVAIFIVLIAIALPSTIHYFNSYRASGAARGIASQIGLARMTAAASFTQAELVINTTAESYQIETCTTKNSSNPTPGGCTTWTAVGGTQYLPAQVFFGYGSITTGVPSQTTIAQTTTIYFNSRGVVVDSTGNPLTTDAVYLYANTGQSYAVAVSAGGKPTVYVYTTATSGNPWSEM